MIISNRSWYIQMLAYFPWIFWTCVLDLLDILPCIKKMTVLFSKTWIFESKRNELIELIGIRFLKEKLMRHWIFISGKSVVIVDIDSINMNKNVKEKSVAFNNKNSFNWLKTSLGMTVPIDAVTRKEEKKRGKRESVCEQMVEQSVYQVGYSVYIRA